MGRGGLSELALFFLCECCFNIADYIEWKLNIFLVEDIFINCACYFKSARLSTPILFSIVKFLVPLFLIQ